MEKPDAGAVASSFQKFEIDKLNQTLKHQRAEIDRLKSLLDNARAGNTFFFCLCTLHSSTGLEEINFYPMFLTTCLLHIPGGVFKTLIVHSVRLLNAGF